PLTERHGRDPRAVVISTVAELRPTVVAARQQQVHFVAAVRPVLRVEHAAGGRVHGEAELIAMTEREDLGPRARLADERIVRRRLAVVAHPQHFAVDVAQVLRGLIERRAGRHVEQAVVAEREPRATVAVLPLAREELLDTGELLAFELAAT